MDTQQPTLPGIPAPTPPAPDTAGGVDLSDDALAQISKRVKNEVISLLSHPGDARDGIHLIVLACLLEAGVITKDNLRAQIVGPLDQYFRDRGFEAMTEVERKETTLPSKSAP